MGGWRTTVASDAFSIALLERDDFTLAQTVGAIGRNFRKLALNDRAEVGAENNAVFVVCAGRRDRATAFVGRLDPRLRARVAVVGRADCMEDSVAALRLGAGELLASPLSPQQIVGFMERASRPPSPNPQRGKLLGLPILREPVARPTLIPDHLIAVRPANGEDLPRAALMLRRFLRGYDEIGEDGAGGLLALVSCSAEDIGSVVDRLTHVFGEKSQVTHKASSAAAARAAV